MHQRFFGTRKSVSAKSVSAKSVSAKSVSAKSVSAKSVSVLSVLATSLGLVMMPLVGHALEERPGQRNEQHKERREAPRLAPVRPQQRVIAPVETFRRTERRPNVAPAYRERRREYDHRDRYDRYEPGFVFLGGPRVIVRTYGYGWCQGLHRGRHWAPGIGWHAGTHRGLFRCSW